MSSVYRPLGGRSILHRLSLLPALIQDLVALAEMMLDLFTAMTDAVAVQQGMLVRSGNTYFRQVQEAVGQQTRWTRTHLRLAGVTAPALSLQERGKETLWFYKETAQLLKPSLQKDHWSMIEQTFHLIEEELSHEKFSS